MVNSKFQFLERALSYVEGKEAITATRTEETGKYLLDEAARDFTTKNHCLYNSIAFAKLILRTLDEPCSPFTHNAFHVDPLTNEKLTRLTLANKVVLKPLIAARKSTEAIANKKIAHCHIVLAEIAKAYLKVLYPLTPEEREQQGCPPSKIDKMRGDVVAYYSDAHSRESTSRSSTLLLAEYLNEWVENYETYPKEVIALDRSGSRRVLKSKKEINDFAISLMDQIHTERSGERTQGAAPEATVTEEKLRERLGTTENLRTLSQRVNTMALKAKLCRRVGQQQTTPQPEGQALPPTTSSPVEGSEDTGSKSSVGHEVPATPSIPVSTKEKSASNSRRGRYDWEAAVVEKSTGERITMLELAKRLYAEETSNTKAHARLAREYPEMSHPTSNSFKLKVSREAIAEDLTTSQKEAIYTAYNNSEKSYSVTLLKVLKEQDVFILLATLKSIVKEKETGLSTVGSGREATITNAQTGEKVKYIDVLRSAYVNCYYDRSLLIKELKKYNVILTPKNVDTKLTYWLDTELSEANKGKIQSSFLENVTIQKTLNDLFNNHKIYVSVKILLEVLKEKGIDLDAKFKIPPENIKFAVDQIDAGSSNWDVQKLYRAKYGKSLNLETMKRIREQGKHWV